MKKYSRAAFKKFEVVNGIRQCPSGDYSGIDEFAERCSFGAGCSFGERCNFGEWCSFGERCSLEGVESIRILQIGPIGSRGGTTLFIKHKDGVRIRCGCFCGEMPEFAARVELTHSQNVHWLREYRGAIEYAKLVLGDAQ